MVEVKTAHEALKEISKEAHPNEQNKRELIILQGITTSQINQALKSPNPYPARVFLKVEGYEQDIPVIFRIIDFEKGVEKKWERPKIKTGSLIECRGYFAEPKQFPQNCLMRKSFTAYSYRLIATPQDLKNKTILDQAKARFPYWQKQVKEFSSQVDFLTKEQELEKIKNYD